MSDRPAQCPAVQLGWAGKCKWPRIPEFCVCFRLRARPKRAVTVPGSDDDLIVRLAGSDPTRPDVAESIRLVRLMGACPYRSRGPGCGCSGAQCALRAGMVSHVDCFDCLRRFG